MIGIGTVRRAALPLAYAVPLAIAACGPTVQNTTIGEVAADANNASFARTYNAVAIEFVRALSANDTSRAYALLAVPPDPSDDLRQQEQQGIAMAARAMNGCSGSVLQTDAGGSLDTADDTSGTIYLSSAFQSGKSDVRTWFRLNPPCGDAALMGQGQAGAIQRCWIGIVLMSPASGPRAMRIDNLACDGRRPSPTIMPAPTVGVTQRSVTLISTPVSPPTTAALPTQAPLASAAQNQPGGTGPAPVNRSSPTSVASGATTAISLKSVVPLPETRITALPADLAAVVEFDTGSRSDAWLTVFYDTGPDPKQPGFNLSTIGFQKQVAGRGEESIEFRMDRISSDIQRVRVHFCLCRREQNGSSTSYPSLQRRIVTTTSSCADASA